MQSFNCWRQWIEFESQRFFWRQIGNVGRWTERRERVLSIWTRDWDRDVSWPTSAAPHVSKRVLATALGLWSRGSNKVNLNCQHRQLNMIHLPTRHTVNVGVEILSDFIFMFSKTSELDLSSSCNPRIICWKHSRDKHFHKQQARRSPGEISQENYKLSDCFEISPLIIFIKRILTNNVTSRDPFILR